MWKREMKTESPAVHQRAEVDDDAVWGGFLAAQPASTCLPTGCVVQDDDENPYPGMIDWLLAGMGSAGMSFELKKKVINQKYLSTGSRQQVYPFNKQHVSVLVWSCMV